MLAKYALAVFFSFVVVCGSVFAGTEPETIDMDQMFEKLQKEISLTQADIDAFIAIAPHVQKMMNDTPDDDPDENVIMQLYDEYNTSPQRFPFVCNKIAVTLAMREGVTLEQLLEADVSKLLIPSQSDIDLVESNFDPISEALSGM